MKHKYAVFILILLGLFFYSLTLKGILGNPKPGDFKGSLDQVTKPLELSPERGRFANVLALADFHTYDLGQELADAVYPDVGVEEGKFYSLFAPGVSYFILPFYLLGEQFNVSLIGSFGFVSIISIFNLLLLFFISRKVFNLPVWASLVPPMVFGFGCTSWSYAVTLYQHQFTVFFMLSSFYAAWKFKNMRRDGEGIKHFPHKFPRPSALSFAPLRIIFRIFPYICAVWVWLAYGLAITADYPNAVLLLPVVLYFVISSLSVLKEKDKIIFALRPAAVFSVIVLVAVGGWNAYHNQKNYGSWKRLSGELVDYSTVLQQGGLGQSNSQQVINKLGEQKGLQTFFQETNLPFSFYTLTVSPDRGLFVYAPIFLLAALGIFFARKSFSGEMAVLLALVAADVLLYSSWGDPWGGWAFGPRYLIPSMAVLSLFIGVFLAQAKNFAWSRILAFILFAYSSGIALLGAVTTNAVPPKIEASSLHSHYNFLFNWDFLLKNKSGSLLYNTFFANRMDLKEYYLVIYAALLAIILIVLFVLPRSERQQNSVKLKDQNVK
ncbi:MAG: hypothetical protein M1383_04615 [Patescibacteria group bacterium]|nr:hypothetical protein [Patescibacteria group bacterium]